MITGIHSFRPALLRFGQKPGPEIPDDNGDHDQVSLSDEERDLFESLTRGIKKEPPKNGKTIPLPDVREIEAEYNPGRAAFIAFLTRELKIREIYDQKDLYKADVWVKSVVEVHFDPNDLSEIRRLKGYNIYIGPFAKPETRTALERVMKTSPVPCFLKDADEDWVRSTMPLLNYYI